MMETSTEKEWKYLGRCEEVETVETNFDLRVRSLNLDSVSHFKINFNCLYFVEKHFIKL